MPALVRAVAVQAGDRVERGATLVVLEAMKMEIRVTAPQASVVTRVRCREGEQVERGQVLVEIHPAEDFP
jgi:biotin carboxyl carrier protein